MNDYKTKLTLLNRFVLAILHVVLPRATAPAYPAPVCGLRLASEEHSNLS